MNEQRTFRVGLVGAGYVSQFHISALQRLPNVVIVGITDIDTARSRAVAERFGLQAFSSLEELVSAGADTVHVLTPPATHAEVAVKALSLGCHVFVEKPLATSVEDCDRIAQAAQMAGKTVCVGHSLLRDPFASQALNIAQSGTLGDVLTVDYFRSSEYPPYRGGPLPPQYGDGGYPFRDLGVHALYLMQEFLGRIQDVSANFRSAGRLSADPNLLYDEWRALVNCERGSGQIQLSWNIKPLQHLLIVQGTRGVLRADLFGMNVTLKRNTPLPKAVERLTNTLREGQQIRHQVLANAWRFARKHLLPYHGLQMLVAEFYANLTLGKPPPVPPAQARSIVEWTERVAREADAAKKRYLARFAHELTATTLVTGATGFIGGHLLRRLLAENHRVRIFVRREPSAELMNDPHVEVVLGDLGDPEAVDRAVAGTQTIYHIGAAMRGGPHDFERATVAGTRHIVESALKHRVGRLVYVSSLAVLHAAAARKGVKMTENWPLEPHPQKRGAYTQAKLEAEKIVLQAVRERGLPAVIIRPGQVFGPGAPLLTPAVARQLKNRLLVLGNGKLVLPLVYVEDVVDALVRAAQSSHFDGAVFHLVDSAEITQNDLLHHYLRATGKQMKVIHVPRPLVCLGAAAAEISAKLLRREAPLSVYRVRSALAPIAFDCSAAANRLGWQPRIGAEKGLERTLASLSH